MKYVIIALSLTVVGCGMFGGKKSSIENQCNFTSAEAKKVAVADVKCAVKQLRPAMKSCFDQEVARNQAFEAAQVVKFEISQDGKAQNIKWEPDPGSSDLVSCTSEVLEGAPFPTHKSAKPAKSRFPFKFKKVAQVQPAPETPEGTTTDEAPPEG